MRYCPIIGSAQHFEIVLQKLPTVPKFHFRMSLGHWQAFWLGVALSIGCLSWLSVQYGGLGHIPRVAELPGIALTGLLDRIPESIAASAVWPGSYLEQLEIFLDNYQCATGHEYRVEIVHHSPVILRLLGFLPSGERIHLLKLAYVSSSGH